MKEKGVGRTRSGFNEKVVDEIEALFFFFRKERQGSARGMLSQDC